MAFPGTYNFNYYRGDTNEFVLRPKNSDGSAFSLEDFGLTGSYTIADKRGPLRTIVKNAAAVINNIDNTITCTIIPDLGRDLSAGSYVYDVEISNPDDSDVKFTLITGTITVTDDITGAA
jgi:hypothetical protein